MKLTVSLDTIPFFLSDFGIKNSVPQLPRQSNPQHCVHTMQGENAALVAAVWQDGFAAVPPGLCRPFYAASRPTQAGQTRGMA